jgi:capsular polysaccharide biosynthesis protein
LSDDTVRLSAIGQILRGRWRFLAMLTVVGAVAGFGASLVLSPGYAASATVLLQGPRQADELLTEAEVATSSVVLDRAAAALGWPVTGVQLRKSVSAAVAGGNVVQITGEADTPERAQRLTDQVAQQFVRFSTQLAGNTGDASAQMAQEQHEALRQQVAQTNQSITDLAKSADQGQTVESVQARTQLEALRTALNQAMNNLDQADAATSRANMVVMGPAERPTGQAPPTRPQLVAGGALLFLVLGALGHLFAARADRRVRGEAEIAAALGTAALGSVDVPTAAGDRPRTPGVRGRIRRLLGVDVPWNLPRPQASGDEASRHIRYRRVLARLRDDLPGPRRVLVVVPADDPLARRCAVRLVAAAGDQGDPVPRVAEVDADRPTVPDRVDASGALVVVGAGSRTAWQLVRIAEACADGGHEVLGAVVAHPVRATGRRSAEIPSRVAVDGDVMAGSA